MLKNKNLNFALIIFVITLSLLFVYAEYYPEAETSATETENVSLNNQENKISRSK